MGITDVVSQLQACGTATFPGSGLSCVRWEGLYCRVSQKACEGTSLRGVRTQADLLVCGTRGVNDCVSTTDVAWLGMHGVCRAKAGQLMYKLGPQVAAFKDYVPDASPSSDGAPPAAEAAPTEAPAGGSGATDFPANTVMGLPALSPTMTQGAPPRDWSCPMTWTIKQVHSLQALHHFVLATNLAHSLHLLQPLRVYFQPDISITFITPVIHGPAVRRIDYIHHIHFGCNVIPANIRALVTLRRLHLSQTLGHAVNHLRCR